VHQEPEFHDPYYFNMHPSSDEWFAVFGFGQYRIAILANYVSHGSAMATSLATGSWSTASSVRSTVTG
jgi:hypothetical protein